MSRLFIFKTCICWGLLTLFQLQILSAQPLTIDFSTLVNQSYKLVGPGGFMVNGNTGQVTEFNNASGGTYTLHMNRSTILSCYIQFDYDPAAGISNVLWMDADGSMAVGFIPLDMQFWSVDNGIFTLKGRSIQLDGYLSNDFTFDVIQIIGQDDIIPNQTFILLPGDYLIKIVHPNQGDVNIIHEVENL